jgi:hypothetical protein
VSLRALGKNVEVQWAIGQQIGKFELCRSTRRSNSANDC